MTVALREVFQQLYDHYGPQHWWPGESALEIMVGAVLTQNTNWKNVERAIENLREAGLLEFDALRSIRVEELAELIRPAGYYRQKARRLHNLLEMIHHRYGGSLGEMFATDPQLLRRRLLEVNGIGPETADSILLYAGNLPSFVVDAYTARVFKRHGWIEPEADYHTIQQFCQSSLPCDAALFNEFHALLVRVGKEHCGTRPKCEGCPLANLLPEGGPLGEDRQEAGEA
ncbi:MAG: endonuclease III domain-containing protein [Pirellulales bacterium]|nr:endonuclease III domain-containing protein [Pirellulales bacterium]